jgi:2-hydroxychromene-2-carboxylate isomerase
MKHLVFWFDVISPYAYLAFERLPQALEGLTYSVEYRPVLFAGLLQHWGQKGPAEIEPKREWTFRQVAWLAAQQGTRLDVPAQHPFNPLAILRLLVAAGANRRTCELAFDHVWHGGADANDPARLDALRTALRPGSDQGLATEPASSRDPRSPEVKDELRATTQDAIERGVFGVPTIDCEGRLFFGVDGLPMLAACMRGDAWFEAGGVWDDAARTRPGVQRRHNPP